MTKLEKVKVSEETVRFLSAENFPLKHLRSKYKY